jgi:hypothetical protein
MVLENATVTCVHGPGLRVEVRNKGGGGTICREVTSWSEMIRGGQRACVRWRYM